jgi:hypothetical protein
MHVHVTLLSDQSYYTVEKFIEYAEEENDEFLLCDIISYLGPRGNCDRLRGAEISLYYVNSEGWQHTIWML